MTHVQNTSRNITTEFFQHYFLKMWTEILKCYDRRVQFCQDILESLHEMYRKRKCACTITLANFNWQAIPNDATRNFSAWDLLHTFPQRGNACEETRVTQQGTNHNYNSTILH